jgi:hypothetical protein
MPLNKLKKAKHRLRISAARSAALWSASAIIIAHSAMGATLAYIGPNDGLFSTPGNWSTGTAPASGDYVGNGGGRQIDFDYVASDYTSGGFSVVFTDSPMVESGTSDPSTPAVLNTDSLVIGDDNFGYFSQGPGYSDNTIGSISRFDGGGNYEITSNLATLTVGSVSGVTMVQEAGSVTVGTITNGTPPDAPTSSYDWTGGTLHLTGQELDFTNLTDTNAPFGNSLTIGSTQTLIVDNNEVLQGNGTAITQNGGSNTANGLFIGNNAGSGTDDTYTLNSGTLTITPGHSEAIGYTPYGGPGGGGTFVQTGGIHTVPLLDIAYDANGVYNLSGSGSLNANDLYLGVLGPGGSLNISGGTVTVVGATVNNGSITQTGGTSSLGALSGAGTISVGFSTGSESHACVNSISQSAVTINDTGLLTILPNVAPTTNAINSLTINGGGVLDLTNNHFIVTYTSGTRASVDASIRSYLISGRNGGLWNGLGGIDSSTAAMPGNSHYGIGYADGADGIVAGLSSGQIEIKYTLLGDADLDGSVTGSDFTALAGNLGKSGVGWDKGDFLYTGAVTGSDFTALVSNLGKSANGADVILPAADYAAIDAFAAANGLMADVPEPTSFGLLGLAAARVLARRRRHS